MSLAATPVLTKDQLRHLRNNPRLLSQFQVCLKKHSEKAAIAFLENQINPERVKQLKPVAVRYRPRRSKGELPRPEKTERHYIGRQPDSGKREQVKAAIAELEQRGEPFTLADIARAAGVGGNYLSRPVHWALRQMANDAIARVQAVITSEEFPLSSKEYQCLKAIQELEARGERFSRYSVTELAGLSCSYLVGNPKMRWLADAAIARVQHKRFPIRPGARFREEVQALILSTLATGPKQRADFLVLGLSVGAVDKNLPELRRKGLIIAKRHGANTLATYYLAKERQS